MSAVLKPLEQPESHSEYVADQAITRRRLGLVSSQQLAETIAFPTQKPRDRPVWLKVLVVGQRVSLAMAALTVTGALSAYALTVDSNRRLTTATATLSRLQDYQQQITTANAVLKNHLTQAANAAVQNGMLHPKDVLFLETERPVLLQKLPAEKVQPTTTDQRFFPKGY